MKRKAVVDFTGYKDPEIINVAWSIHKALGDNAGTFTAPTVTLIAFATQIEDTETKLNARATGAKLAITKFAASRKALEGTMTVLGHYVNGVAQGDPDIVVQSGFPYYDTGHTADTSPPPAPTNLRLRQGGVSGCLKALYKPHRTNSTNEVQTNIVDPIHETDWHTKGMFKGGRVILDGFTPGGLVWVRVRTTGLKGVMGDWSDIAQIRLL